MLKLTIFFFAFLSFFFFLLVFVVVGMLGSLFLMLVGCGFGMVLINVDRCICVTLCTTGKYQDEDGQVECKSCASGYYNDELGQSKCKPCTAGLFNLNPGTIALQDCQDCPTGKILQIQIQLVLGENFRHGPFC